MEVDLSKRTVWSWALYDWANSAFATTVMAGLFPVFFKEYWYPGDSVNESTFQLGWANSIAGLFVALMAPALGAIADRGSAKKKFLFTFAYLGIVSTFSLFFVAEGANFLALGVFVFAVIGFSGSNIFYDSLIVSVSDDETVDKTSAFGFSLGYLGGGVLFAGNVAAVTYWERLGLPSQSVAVQYSFVSVAIWWALFSIPIFLFVKEPRIEGREFSARMVKAGFKQLAETFREIRKYKVVGLFILAYWFYIDGVHTVIRMAVDFGQSLGFPSESLIIALLITQFVGFPATLVFGALGKRIGAKTGIYIGIGVYTCVCIGGYFMQEEIHFYILAVTIGLVQGAVQSLSRSLYSRIIPRDKAAEFFGFYNMMGKFAAVLGPVLMGTVSYATGSARLSIVSLVILFGIGAFFLKFVDEKEGIAAARAAES